MLVSPLAREVAIGYWKREIEDADVVGTGRRMLWDVLLKGCKEILGPDAGEAWRTFRELWRGS